MVKILRSLAVVILVAALLNLVPAEPVQAAGVVGDGTPASCTDAAFESKLAPGNLVTFNCGPNHITINIALKDIFANATIDGGGLVTLGGSNHNQLFTVNGSATLTLKNLGLANGYTSTGQGGAILNYATLIIDHSQFTGNSTNNTFFGGAIASSGTLTVTNSTFTQNGSGGGGAIFNAGTAVISNTTFISDTAKNYGGAIYNYHSPITLIGDSFSHNTSLDGGGMYSDTGNANLTHVTFSHNSATAFGGGIYNLMGPASLSDINLSDNSARGGGGIDNIASTLQISDSVFTGNTVINDGGGLLTSGTAILADITFSGNSAGETGGGVDSGNLTDLTVSDALFSGNSANSGGGLSINSDASLTNVTLSDNTAGYGAGLRITGQDVSGNTISLDNVTLSDNSASVEGGAIYEASYIASHIYLSNTLLAHGAAGGNCHVVELTAPITSSNFNLSDDASCASYLNQPKDQNGVDAQLGPLRDNGGPTLTRLPHAGSPAIDHGGAGCAAIDQRGISRPQGPACDIGAVERQASDVDLSWGYLPLVRR